MRSCPGVIRGEALPRFISAWFTRGVDPIEVGASWWTMSGPARRAALAMVSGAPAASGGFPAYRALSDHWTPDLCLGVALMTDVQAMLLQIKEGEKHRLFAWLADRCVDFQRLAASKSLGEDEIFNGRSLRLKFTPPSLTAHVIVTPTDAAS